MAWLKVLFGQFPKTTYTQLPVLYDPDGIGDFTLVRDSADGLNSAPIPVRVKLDDTAALLAQKADDTVVFQVNTNTEEAIVRVTRETTTETIPSSLAVGQIAANVEDGQIFLGGTSQIFTFDVIGMPAPHTHDIADLLQSGSAVGETIYWDGTAWERTTLVAIDDSLGAAVITIQADLIVDNDAYVGGDLTVIGTISGGTY